jgi:hypothetical protein
MDTLIVDQVNWAGRLEEPGFLARVWDLTELASTARDVWQHGINDHDWEDDWILHEDRFDLAGCQDEVLAKLVLCSSAWTASSTIFPRSPPLPRA